MTIEEKRKAIEAHCDKYEFCRKPDGTFCELYSLAEDTCYSDNALIEKHYDILFGDNEKPFDVVEKAEHYNQGGIECIEAIKASMTPEEYDGFLKGQVIKYVWRYRHKGKPVEDLKKARYYLDKLIEKTEDPA